MGFFWKCPECEKEYTYNGIHLEKAGGKCSNGNCSRYRKITKIYQYRVIKKSIPNILEKVDNIPFNILRKPQKLEYNGMVKSLIIALNYAINTIKNKKPVKECDVNSTWYQYYKDWSRIRSYFQSLEEDKG